MDNDTTLFEKYYNDKEYIVKDIVNIKKTRIIFILESPHTDELIERYPVAGQTGLHMANFLKLGDGKTSLGKVAKEDSSLGITILNVSRVPLQSTDRHIYIYKELIERVNKIIRCGYKSFGKHSKNKELNAIEDLILEDFRIRYKKINLNDDTLIVVCGEFARVYFDKIKNSKSKAIYVPHPSRNQWKNNFEGLMALSRISLIN